MHPFVAKVAVAALVLTLASVAGASQARSDTTGILSGSWYNSYDAPKQSHNHSAPADKIIIEKGSVKHAQRHTFKRHTKPVLGKRVKHRYYTQQPRRRTVHSSGYSW